MFLILAEIKEMKIVRFGDKYAIQKGWLKKRYLDLKYITLWRVYWTHRDELTFKNCLGTVEECYKAIDRLEPKGIEITNPNRLIE